MAVSRKRFVKLMELQNPGELAFVKSLLDGNDMDYYVQNEHFGALYNIPVLPSAIMVDEWDLARAQILLSLLRPFPIRKEAG